MTLKLKSTTNELWKCWKLVWFHHFTHIECAKKLRGLRKKLDPLRVQNGQSLSKYQGFRRKLVCYKGISFFKTYFNSRLFVRPVCTIWSHAINFQPFLTSFAIFHAFTDYFLAKMTLKLKSTTNELWKCWKLAWYHHFTHMACAKKLRGLRLKNGSTSCTKWAISFEISGFHTKSRLIQRNFIFLKLISTPDFLCVQYSPLEATASIFNPFWLHLLFLMHLLIFFELNDPEIEKNYNWTLERLKVGMVSSFHPHSMC